MATTAVHFVAYSLKYPEAFNFLDDFRATIFQALNAPCRVSAVVLDMTAVEYLDKSGVEVLLTAKYLLAKAFGEPIPMHFANANPKIHNRLVRVALYSPNPDVEPSPNCADSPSSPTSPNTPEYVGPSARRLRAHSKSALSTRTIAAIARIGTENSGPVPMERAFSFESQKSVQHFETRGRRDIVTHVDKPLPNLPDTSANMDPAASKCLCKPGKCRPLLCSGFRMGRGQGNVGPVRSGKDTAPLSVAIAAVPCVDAFFHATLVDALRALNLRV
ncbi:hypothetical protein HDU83_003847 [Entophlyctis luteolus]|nr:hypothetical protein HDU82_000570 [Entophlyctis luteolus]KAJ3345667.1 hypothetical protein HDU83_003847 [Entophlyctis luteolus]KAJ3383899.1 hypothetical protein HDU84_003302 [Entophlyctis sp. JEL0112]